MNFYLKRSVKQQAHYISQISSWLSKPCDLGSKPQVVTLDSRKLRDLRIESRELGCEVLSTYFWAVLYYLLTRCTGPDVHMKCIKNENILQFCSQVRPNTKIHRLGFSAKQDNQPFLFLFCCLKAFAHYRGMCMWVLMGDINGYCLFLGELNCFL